MAGWGGRRFARCGARYTRYGNISRARALRGVLIISYRGRSALPSSPLRPVPSPDARADKSHISNPAKVKI